MFTKRYFICQDEKSSKFWDIEFQGEFVKSFGTDLQCMLL